MSESKTKKRTHKNLQGDVVQRLMEKYGFSRRYIQMSVRGYRHSEMSDVIKKDYNEMCDAIAKAINGKSKAE